jgi:polysaccharide deacetylase 2 family uncharacterized protein YibQ
VAVLFPACRSKEPEVRQPTASAKRRGRAVSPARLAIIIDDMGYDPAAAGSLFALPYPLTFSVLPYAPHSAEVAEQAHQRGYHVMLHLPMESANGEAKREAVFLHLGASSQETAQIVSGMLATVPYASGVNNHQGSLATTDPALMQELMSVLQERRLYFIDSRTTPASRGYAVARQSGVPAAYRRVFLDDVETREATLRQLVLAAQDAEENGWSIAIGHPHPTTIEALREFLPRAQANGIHLVFASDLVQ